MTNSGFPSHLGKEDAPIELGINGAHELHCLVFAERTQHQFPQSTLSSERVQNGGDCRVVCRLSGANRAGDDDTSVAIQLAYRIIQ